MKKLLERYCLDEKETGLLLLDMPTGTGKTHNVLEFIKDYLRSNKDKKIFFITTLKKNVDDPFEKLLKALERDRELKDLVIRILSNKDYAIENFSKVSEKIKIQEIKNSEEFRSFNALIKAGVKAPEAYGDTERKLRLLISGILARKFKKKEDKLNAIKNDNEWKWVGELYPVVFSEEKRVFFITMKKLINQFDTIIEKSVKFYENKIFRNSLVFIDEFDATKSDIQDAIVQEGISNSIDFIELFRSVKVSLDKSDTIPANILDNVDNKPSHKKALEKNIKIFDEISSKYHLLLNHKSEGFEEKRIVLFSDLSCNCYTTSEENVTAEHDKRRNINLLKLVDNEHKDRSLYEALDKIKGAISHFARFVTILSYSYYKIKRDKREEGKTYGDFTEFHALDTVIDSLHLQGEAARVIRQMALTNSYRYKTKGAKTEDIKDDLSFYLSGFSHYDFKDDYKHDNKTIIRKFVFEDTPESTLCDICNQSKVVGISATATFKTVLGNYDIDYLKWRLGDRFVEPTQEEKIRLRETFEELTKGYDNIDFNVELTETNCSEAPNWKKIYKDEEAAEEAQRTSSQKHKEHKEDGDKSNKYYCEVRYYKAVLAFKQFMDHDIQSYLALFSKGAKAKDRDFDLNKLKRLFGLYAKDCGKSFSEEMIVAIDSEDFNSKKNALIDDLGKGERRFIISTYATLGAGQNLQYKIPYNRKNDIAKINDRSGDKEEMDIDGMYLDKPTYLINLYSDVAETAINRVFQMEYLHQIKAISYKQKMDEIVNTYKCIDRPKESFPKGEYPIPIKTSTLKDVKVYATKIITQAVGRKCRTPFRVKEMYMLADSELSNALDEQTLFHEGRMFNRELMEIAKKLNCKSEEPENRILEIAREEAIRSNKRIMDLLNRSFEHTWNETDIQIWQNEREYALMHPTLSKEEWANSPYQNHYITLGEPTKQYYYQQNGDFEIINEISLSHFENACHVSEENVNLSKILEDFGKGKLKEYFQKCGYATEFVEGDYIMTPPFYQNIYKGALGEVIGKEIFKWFKIPLEELVKEEYEMFDYKVTGKPIYVDFKYWKESSRFDANTYHNKVIEKAKKCEGIETVIIANVRDTGIETISETMTKDGLKIVEFSLICNSVLSQNAAKKIQEFK